MVRSRKIALFVLLALALLGLCALWRGLTLRIYSVRNDKLAAGGHLRLALLTDLHSCVYGENHAELIDLVLSQRPDAILLGGDIVDDVDPLENAASFFDALSRLAIPTYYVSGNHDRWRPDFEQVCAIIERAGVTILEDESVTLDLPCGRVRLCGVREYASAAACREGLTPFAELDERDFNVLLAHRPDYIDLYRQYPFDLVLSGHTHGGQVRIPFLVNGLFAPNQGWFPPYAGGMYAVGDAVMIVSRGLSYNPRLPRVFNPPEVVIVDIEGGAAA